MIPRHEVDTIVDLVTRRLFWRQVADAAGFLLVALAGLAAVGVML